MKKKWFLIIGGIIVLVVFVVLALKTSSKKRTTVIVERADKGDITSIVTASGKVKAQADVQISADVMGRIEQLPVKEGDTVHASNLLVQIDSRSRTMAVAQAKGSLLSAQSALENARVVLEREKQLFEKNMSSKAQLDIAQNNFDQAQAQVQINEANLDQAQDQLDKCTIRAPMAGVITKLNSEEGENVVIGTMNAPGTVIMVISDLSAIEIEADVDETDIGSVAVGQDVKIALDAFPDTTFKGRVIEVGNSAKASSTSLADQVTNFVVKILIEDRVPNIKPGMTASVDITTAKRQDVIRIPSGAVVMRPKGTENDTLFAERGRRTRRTNPPEADTGGLAASRRQVDDIDGVFVVRSGRARFMPVGTGIRDQQFVEITSGLAAGDSVVTGPYKTLRMIKQGEDIKPEKPKFGPAAEKSSITID